MNRLLNKLKDLLKWSETFSRKIVIREKTLIVSSVNMYAELWTLKKQILSLLLLMLYIILLLTIIILIMPAVTRKTEKVFLDVLK